MSARAIRELVLAAIALAALVTAVVDHRRLVRAENTADKAWSSAQDAREEIRLLRLDVGDATGEQIPSTIQARLKAVEDKLAPADSLFR